MPLVSFLNSSHRADPPAYTDPRPRRRHKDTAVFHGLRPLRPPLPHRGGGRAARRLRCLRQPAPFGGPGDRRKRHMRDLIQGVRKTAAPTCPLLCVWPKERPCFPPLHGVRWYDLKPRPSEVRGEGLGWWGRCFPASSLLPARRGRPAVRRPPWSESCGFPELVWSALAGQDPSVRRVLGAGKV